MGLLVASSLGAAARAHDPQTPQAPAKAEKPAETPPADDEAEKKKIEEQITRELQGTPSPSPSPPAGAEGRGAAVAPTPEAAPAGSAPTGASPYARLLVMPDVSAIGSLAGALDTLDVPALSPRSGPFSPRDRPAFIFQELELGLQAVVDPYARADAFVSFSPEGADVEEAYLTTLTLPAGLQVKAGRFFSPFGRQNQQHPHIWEFVDAPLAQSRLLASESLSGGGVDLAWLAPLPWFAELHLAAQSTSGVPSAAAGEFQDEARLTGAARLVQFFALGEAATLGVGVSAARREEPGGAGAFRDLGGADVYVRVRPEATRSYATFNAELYARRLRGIPGVAGGTDTGGWAQVFLRRGPYYGYGVRFDYAPSAAEGISGAEQRFGAVGTWFLSEFQRVRAQVSYDRLPDGKEGVEALLHLEFGIGAHGAHPF